MHNARRFSFEHIRLSPGSSPKLVSSIYGILGNLDTQIPSTVLHVDPRTKIAYVGIWTPATVLEYSSDARSGPARLSNYIGGRRTTLDSVPAAITTDAKWRRLPSAAWTPFSSSMQAPAAM